MNRLECIRQIGERFRTCGDYLQGVARIRPFSGLRSMTEFFRRRVIKLLVERKLLNNDIARNLLISLNKIRYEPLSENEEEVDIDARKRAWARLLAKVYEGITLPMI